MLNIETLSEIQKIIVKNVVTKLIELVSILLLQ